ncbi:type II toxin-antitoxin system VapC family toxin [Loktanella sp. DJP18]|uniref:type II toxin-antitoxin system VapC family toxin n=1 Tax=Loktanella sp. DJP18 TaxID=3409788 RepID=UPI003BB6D0C9
MNDERGFVIDASVAIKWIIDEEDSPIADLLQGFDMAAPAQLRIETANALSAMVARHALSQAGASELYSVLQAAPVTIVDADDNLEARALELAMALHQSVQACIYLALAERLKRRLITADRTFLRTLDGTEHARHAVHLHDLEADQTTMSNQQPVFE